jgi:hypothetical protein
MGASFQLAHPPPYTKFLTLPYQVQIGAISRSFNFAVLKASIRLLLRNGVAHMRFEIWNYCCSSCGAQFESPVFTGPLYGLFTLYSRSGELRTLDALGDPVFSEVYEFVSRRYPRRRSGELDQLSKYLFGFTCDHCAYRSS